MDVGTSVCAGIVTFNPDIELLRRNIESIKDQVDHVVLYDNGSKRIDGLDTLVQDFSDYCLILKGSVNRGIAYALNRLCEWAEEKGYQQILTLDQDSISPSGMVDILLKYAGKDVAIVAPNIVYKNNESFAQHSAKHYEMVDWVITSASLTNLRAWKTLGGFDEWLFIDGVDFDFGLRANAEGYKVIKTYNSELLHELGKLKCVKVFGKTIYVTNHSAWRKYYMARNTIYLRHKLRKGTPVRTISKYIIKTIVFEDKKMEKMASIVRGISDGLEKIRGVLVIVSTYNGEEFLREQIDSLLNQTGIEVHILIRDDGSSDGTVEILKEYDRKYDNISFYIGENKGVIGSFNDLMFRPELDNYKYIAFCDQDDVWDQDKLHIAVSHIGDDNKVPVMYCCNLMLVDRELKPIKPMRNTVKKYTAHMSVVQNIGTGCTQVFNHKALELYRTGIGSSMEMHDYWMTLLCLFLGRVIYDNNTHIQYRQHGTNVVGAQDKQISVAVKNIQNHSGRRKAMIKNFMDSYYLGKDADILRPMIENGLSNRLKMSLSLEYVGIMLSVTIGFKVRSLVGRMY